MFHKIFEKINNVLDGLEFVVFLKELFNELTREDGLDSSDEVW